MAVDRVHRISKWWLVAGVIVGALLLALGAGGVASAAGSAAKLDANSVTANRSVQQVAQIRDGFISSYSTSGMFATKPVLTQNGYNPGKLSSSAKTKTLQQLNQYRKLAGLNSDIRIYEDNMKWSQYGATGMEIVNSLTHSFTSSQKTKLLKYMSSDEYELAAKGIGAGILPTSSGTLLWNGNCHGSNNVVLNVKSYIDDTANVSAGVGHRLNMLDINGQYAWFGASKSSYSCMSIAGNPFASNPNTEDYYAWPSEGYFPKQLLPDSAEWSIAFNKQYGFAGNAPCKVTLTYKGVRYNATIIDASSNYNMACPTVTFELPAKLKSALASSSSVYGNAGVATVTVKVEGIVNENTGQTVYAEYPVKLFKQTPVALKGISISSTSKTIPAGWTRDLKVVYKPTNATPTGKVTWKSSNPSVATVSSTGKLTALKQGTTKITAMLQGYQASVTITVTKAQIAASNVTGVYDAYRYRGRAYAPVPTVRVLGKKLVRGTDYTVTYSAGRKNVGTYKVTVRGKGKYAGTVVKSFKINPKPVTMRSTKGINNGGTVKWNKSKYITNLYQIRFSSNSAMKNPVTFTMSKVYNTTTIKGLGHGKKYWVQVRAIRTVGGKDYYSAWTSKWTFRTK